MRVVGREKVDDFLKHHEDIRQDVSELIRDLEKKMFTKPAELLEHYPSARVLNGKHVVFKIRGNNYRLVAAIAYNVGTIVIEFCGTHKQYDRLNIR